ncbi:hypothetical protein L7F22_057621 [Adiantum nelumboides]|nr:hypothetical protein [Adiantum nelumboides]
MGRPGLNNFEDFQVSSWKSVTLMRCFTNCCSKSGGLPVKAVAAGLWHTVCITESGDVYSFGGNQFGQLGTGNDQAELLPRLLDTPALENVHATSVSCGARHSAICTDTGRIFCWGWNKYGQLGQGDALDRSSPVEVLLEGSSAREIACGWWHTLCLVQSAC